MLNKLILSSITFLILLTFSSSAFADTSIIPPTSITLSEPFDITCDSTIPNVEYFKIDVANNRLGPFDKNLLGEKQSLIVNSGVGENSDKKKVNCIFYNSFDVKVGIANAKVFVNKSTDFTISVPTEIYKNQEITLTCDSKVSSVEYFKTRTHGQSYTPEFSKDLLGQPVQTPYGTNVDIGEKAQLTCLFFNSDGNKIGIAKGYAKMGQKITPPVILDPILPDDKNPVVIVPPITIDVPSTPIVIDPPVTHTAEKKNGGNDDGCFAPTIGLNSNGKRFVDNGLILNDYKNQTGFFKDHMPMQYTEIGRENHIEIKVYDCVGPWNMDFIQFGIVKEIGTPLSEAKVLWEIDVAHFANDIENPKIETMNLLDEKGIIQNSSVGLSLTPCMENIPQTCLTAILDWSFDKVPEDQVLVVNGWNNHRQSFTHYFNDGMTVIDPNYVEPIPEEPYKYECKDKPLDQINSGYDRNNCNFKEYKKLQAQKALTYYEES